MGILTAVKKLLAPRRKGRNHDPQLSFNFGPTEERRERKRPEKRVPIPAQKTEAEPKKTFPSGQLSFDFDRPEEEPVVVTHANEKAGKPEIPGNDVGTSNPVEKASPTRTNYLIIDDNLGVGVFGVADHENGTRLPVGINVGSPLCQIPDFDIDVGLITIPSPELDIGQLIVIAEIIKILRDPTFSEIVNGIEQGSKLIIAVCREERIDMNAAVRRNALRTRTAEESRPSIIAVPATARVIPLIICVRPLFCERDLSVFIHGIFDGEKRFCGRGGGIVIWIDDGNRQSRRHHRRQPFDTSLAQNDVLIEHI